LQQLLKAALLAGLIMGIVTGLASCKADEAPAPAETQAEPEKKPVVDQKIANAVAAAQAKAQTTSPSGEGQLAPPAPTRRQPLPTLLHTCFFGMARSSGGTRKVSGEIRQCHVEVTDNRRAR